MSSLKGYFSKVVVLSLFLSLLFSLSCVKNTRMTIDGDGEKEEERVTEKDIDWSKAESAKIKGKIEVVNEDLIYIETNWTSRSKVSYQVFGEHRPLLAKNHGKIAIVSGKVVDGSNPWSKKLLVLSVTKIE